MVIFKFVDENRDERYSGRFSKVPHIYSYLKASFWFTFKNFSLSQVSQERERGGEKLEREVDE